jgi:hypothetical protein
VTICAQAWEESFWCRLAYHCAREFETDAEGGPGTFHPAVDAASGAFTLAYRRGGEPVVQVAVPRGRVRAALELLAAARPSQPGDSSPGGRRHRPRPLRTAASAKLLQ